MWPYTQLGLFSLKHSKQKTCDMNALTARIHHAFTGKIHNILATCVRTCQKRLIPQAGNSAQPFYKC